MEYWSAGVLRQVRIAPLLRGVQFGLGASNWVDTPFLQATTFEHEHEHEHERRTPNAERRAPNAKRLVRACLSSHLTRG